MPKSCAILYMTQILGNYFIHYTNNRIIYMDVFSWNHFNILTLILFTARVWCYLYVSVVYFLQGKQKRKSFWKKRKSCNHSKTEIIDSPSEKITRPRHTFFVWRQRDGQGGRPSSTLARFRPPRWGDGTWAILVIPPPFPRSGLVGGVSLILCWNQGFQ